MPHRTLVFVDPALERFRLRALSDRALRERLLAEPDPRRFAVLVVSLAAVEGIDIAVDSVTAELSASHERWLTRWI